MDILIHSFPYAVLLKCVNGFIIGVHNQGFIQEFAWGGKDMICRCVESHTPWLPGTLLPTTFLQFKQSKIAFSSLCGLLMNY